MSHLSFQPKGPEIQLSADVVVVGSGAGGAAAAVQLARAGVSVVVIEAGPWRDPLDYPHSTYGAMRDVMDDWGATVTLGRALWPVVQARLVGGTTVINSAICVRTPADIFEEWQQNFGIGADLSERVWKYQDQLETELCVEETAPAALGRSNELAIKGDAAANYGGHLIKRYAKGCEGSGQCLQGCRALRKQSTNRNFIPETLKRGGTLLSCAPVEKIIFENHRAVGVQGRFIHPQSRATGAAFRVQARKAVIVAASATHSPVLLQRSGIKHKAVGSSFKAHPGTGVFGVYDTPVDQNAGVTQGWSSMQYREHPGVKLETLSIPMEMAISRLAGGGRALMEHIQDYRHLAMWIHALRAKSSGRVDAGWGGKPVVRYSLDEADMRRFREGMVLVAKLHFAAGAKAIVPAVQGLPYRLGPDQLDLLANGPLNPQNYVAILSHLFGGCPMGADPKQSVCDGRGRVHGSPNLYIADASMFPDNIGVNPQHTIMALAMIVADHVIQDF